LYPTLPLPQKQDDESVSRRLSVHGGGQCCLTRRVGKWAKCSVTGIYSINDDRKTWILCSYRQEWNWLWTGTKVSLRHTDEWWEHCAGWSAAVIAGICETALEGSLRHGVSGRYPPGWEGMQGAEWVTRRERFFSVPFEPFKFGTIGILPFLKPI
jgi:hypothetical protein